ncbi:MAG: exodeoxyribonuclease III [Minisyncoccia bacterium]|jgi:exodeoxyribonuclease-3
MKIISWNVNGLRLVYQKGFPAWLEKCGADIVCVQEVKAQATTVPQDLFSGSKYSFVANYAERPGYSGVGVYYKERPKKIEMKLGHVRFDSEGRMVRLDYPDFTFIGLYIPNGARDQRDMAYKLEVYEHLFKYLKIIKQKNVVLAGDFNIAHAEIDLARPKENKNNTMFTPEERKQFDAMESLGFIDSFRKLHASGGHYSWWPYFANARERNLGWRIDYVFVSKNLVPKLKESFILPAVTSSDHCPVGVELTPNL